MCEAVERIGNSSITLREEIRTLAGELAAESEAVLVARNRATGRSRPLTEAERDAMPDADTVWLTPLPEIVDLRSDTVTQPTTEMLDAMRAAPLGCGASACRSRGSARLGINSCR